MSLAGVNCHVFVDFDGTIVPCDATDFIFASFADDRWRDVETEWQTGQIGSRECMSRQVALLRAAPEQMLEAVSQIKVDPGFATFVEDCRRQGIGMTVVSDGFDYVIERVLRNAGHPNIRYYANHLVPMQDGRWNVTFPHAREGCGVLAGNCKCSFTEPYTKAIKVVVGDGRSDFCVAGQADLVFAKGTLLTLCQTNGTAHFPYNDFFTVTRQLNAWLRSASKRALNERAAVA